MIRQDVWHLAERLGAAADISINSVYDWLMKIGREHSKNPRHFSYTVRYHHIHLDADPEGTYVEPYKPESRRCCSADNDAAAYYWEGRVLARQEAGWLD